VTVNETHAIIVNSAW